jgi:hypothetical protein
MKIAEETTGQRLAATIAPRLSPIQSVVKKHGNRALKTLDAVLKAAEEAPPRMVAAAMAGILVFSIGFVESVIKLFG